MHFLVCIFRYRLTRDSRLLLTGNLTAATQKQWTITSYPLKIWGFELNLFINNVCAVINVQRGWAFLAEAGPLTESTGLSHRGRASQTDTSLSQRGRVSLKQRKAYLAEKYLPLTDKYLPLTEKYLPLTERTGLSHRGQASPTETRPLTERPGLSKTEKSISWRKVFASYAEVWPLQVG